MHRLPLTGMGEPSTTGPQQRQGPQGRGAEPHGQDHQNHRDHMGGDIHQHSIGATKGATTGRPQPQGLQEKGGTIP